MSKLELTDEQIDQAHPLELVTKLHRNDLERLDLWDLAILTANVPAKTLETYPLYAQILIAQARRKHNQFDPAWRKAHGYPEVI